MGEKKNGSQAADTSYPIPMALHFVLKYNFRTMEHFVIYLKRTLRYSIYYYKI